MVSLRTLLSQHFHTILKHQTSLPHLLTNPPYISSNTHFIYPNSHKYFTFSSLFQTPISIPAQIELESNVSSEIVETTDHKTKKNKKPLDVVFKEAVGLSEKAEQTESDIENDNDLKKTLRKLEKEVRNLKSNSTKKTKEIEAKRDECFDDNQSNPKSSNPTSVKGNGGSKYEYSKPRRLYTLFTKKKNTNDSENRTEKESPRRETMPLKELSPDMLSFVNHLFKEGYFNDANFLPWKAFDVSCFDDTYGREYIKFAAIKFGNDNQEITKWLSGSDLKSVALFGCPSLARKNIFAAKRLRIFFQIQEDTVCSKCVLKESCKFVNQSVWKGDRNLRLVDVSRIITLYALEATPPRLVVSDEVKASVSRLLKEVVNLSRTIS